LFDDVVFEEACGFKASLASPDDITALKEALASERATALDIAAELAVARAKASEDSALIPSRSCGSPSWSARSMGKDRKVVIDPPTACECCGGNRLRKLSEDVTRTLESSPRRWKVIETVREKFSCRDCQKISQAPAPFHAVARGWAGPSLLAMIMFEKFGQHQPLNRQAERYALEGVPIALSTMADAVGSVCAALDPLLRLVEAHVMAAERLHADDTTVPVLARGCARFPRKSAIFLVSRSLSDKSR
jgi:transposase